MKTEDILPGTIRVRDICAITTNGDPMWAGDLSEEVREEINAMLAEQTCVAIRKADDFANWAARLDYTPDNMPEAIYQLGEYTFTLEK